MFQKYGTALCFFCILLAASGLNAQNVDIIAPRLNGLEIGATYSAIVKKLGKPVSEVRRGEVPCGGPMRTLRYKGLILRLESGGIDPLGLYSVEVTSPEWSISGLHIGASRSQVVAKFGRGPHFIIDGYAHLYFERNRLVKMRWEFNFC